MTEDTATEATVEQVVATPQPERQIGDVILRLENISISFGGVKALDRVSFDILEGEIRAIIGPNGAGKSSMLNVINASTTRTKGRSPSGARPGRICGPTRRRATASRGPFRTSPCSRACPRSTTS